MNRKRQKLLNDSILGALLPRHFCKGEGQGTQGTQGQGTQGQGIQGGQGG